MKRASMRPTTCLLVAALMTLALTQATPASAGTTRYVQNWGVDSPTCGTTISPCRSITQALTLSAMSGDTVLVGPGIYSDDLNGNMMYGDPGEEATPITISKSVQVLSTHGAEGTVIAQTHGPNYAISIESSASVVFGLKNKGFTIALREGWVGINDLHEGGVVTIAGNFIFMTPHAPAGPTYGIEASAGMLSTSVTVIKDNEVIGYRNSNVTTSDCYGVYIDGSSELNNVIDHNAAGNCSLGFFINGGHWSVTNNSAGGNLGDGLNSGFGFFLYAFYPLTLTEFSGNNATFNAVGVDILPGVAIASFTGNTYVANTSNCGVRNRTGGVLVATGNFWGSTSGPGPDPADDICNGGASTTATSPAGTVDTTPKQHPRR